MSLRVQKGGTVFKPMAKARPRAGPDDSRQPSSTPDPRAATTSTTPAISPSLERANASPAVTVNTPTLARSQPPQQQQPLASTSQSQLPEPSTERSTSARPPAIQTSVRPSGTSIPSIARAVGPPTRPPATITAPTRSPGVMPPPPVVTNAPRAGPSQTSTHASAMLPPAPQPSVQPEPPQSTSRQPQMIDPSLLPPVHPTTTPDHEQINNPPDAFQQPSGLDFVALIAQAARAANGDLPLAPPAGFEQGTPFAQPVDDESTQSSRPRRSKRTITSTHPTTEDDGPPAKKRRSRKKTGESDDEAEPKKRVTRKGRKKSAVEGRDSNFNDEGTVDGEPRKKRRGRKARSPVRFDADADPGEELDPTVVTMADLCEDTGQGRVSSKAAQIFENHANWKRANRERRARMRAISERKKYGLKDEEGEGEGEQAANKGEPEEIVVPGSPPATVEDEASSLFDADGDAGEAEGDDDDFDYSAVGGGSKFAPRFRIGPNGETIIDETSLHVDRDEEAETAGYQHVEESDATKFTNSATYGKKVHGSRWSAEETEMFFDALRQFGENYELISYVLPGRDRKQCKNKFKAEDKKNSARIDECLNNRAPIDMQTLSRLTGKDFSGPTPVIRAKTPPNLSGMDPSVAVVAEDASSVRKQSSTPGPSDKGGKRGKKKGNAKADDGVEILGAADGVWDSD